MVGPLQPKRNVDPYQQIWDAFQQSETTSDGRHDTPYWRAQTGPYSACVVRVPGQVLEPGLSRVRGDLSRLLGTRIHPDHFLHIMLQELGFVVDQPRRPDEISAARLEEFAHAAAEPVSRIAPFPVALGGVNTFQDAVFLEVRSAEPLAQIHERLFDLAAVPHVPTFPYLPHCTIAHYDGNVSPREAMRILDPWRNDVCGEFMVAEIEIVTIDPAESYPELESFAVIPLAT